MIRAEPGLDGSLALHSALPRPLSPPSLMAVLLLLSPWSYR